MNVTVNLWWVITPAIIIFLSIVGHVLQFLFRYSYLKKDLLIFLDKERAELHFTKLDGKNAYKFGERTYILTDGVPTKAGRSLFIFDKRKPNSLGIKGNELDWIDSSAMTVTINNEILKRIATAQKRMTEILLLISAIAAVTGALVGIFTMCKVFGWIKGK